jgi:hypothetical protein
VFSFRIGTKTSLCPGVDPSCCAIGSFCFGIGTLPRRGLEGAGNSHFSVSPLTSAERCKPRTHARTCVDNLLTSAGPIPTRWGRDWRLIAAISDENLRRIAAERCKPRTHARTCVDNLPMIARPILHEEAEATKENPSLRPHRMISMLRCYMQPPKFIPVGKLCRTVRVSDA